MECKYSLCLILLNPFFGLGTENVVPLLKKENSFLKNNKFVDALDTFVAVGEDRREHELVKRLQRGPL
jgi:hypothetical protein